MKGETLYTIQFLIPDSKIEEFKRYMLLSGLEYTEEETGSFIFHVKGNIDWNNLRFQKFFTVSYREKDLAHIEYLRKNYNIHLPEADI